MLVPPAVTARTLPAGSAQRPRGRTQPRAELLQRRIQLDDGLLDRWKRIFSFSDLEKWWQNQPARKVAFCFEAV